MGMLATSILANITAIRVQGRASGARFLARSMPMTTVLADTVLIAHALVVLFIVGGFAAIWCGAARHWGWVREPHFRFIHLASIGIVATLALLGVPCPLTVLEARLRHGEAGSQGFIEYWVGQLLYYDLPTWVFTAIYAAFALIVLLTWRFVPPRSRSRS